MPRIFEFRDGEVIGFPDSTGNAYPITQMMIDLDSVVMLQEIAHPGGTAANYANCLMQLSSGFILHVKKTAFDRVSLAWRAK